MMSRWPFVTGSNEPGQRAVANAGSSVRVGVLEEDDERIPEGALPRGLGARRRRDRRRPFRPLEHDERVRREQASRRRAPARPRRRRRRRASYGGSANTRSNGASRGRGPARKRADVVAHDRGRGRRSRAVARFSVDRRSPRSGRARRTPRAPRRATAPRCRARRMPAYRSSTEASDDRAPRVAARRTPLRAPCPSSAARRRRRNREPAPARRARDHPHAAVFHGSRPLTTRRLLTT